MNSVDFFKCLSNEIRMTIVEVVLESEMISVTEISDQLKLKQSTVSHHLAILRKTGIIKNTKHGTWVYYSISSELKNIIRDLLVEVGKLN
ncbi:ArsR/SmtB family transcription factor [Acinetobacter sp. ANC 4173]|uniref:ArsR/SmtB family transcription factor n=1 Tax=Acinetobacter sp. ANC 4173 TaxID=2529837 RepID=UPI00103C3B91|nr:metalloregulator ArsR/SmtB family transcription factor [Acinetobacter sp. ANC 4173]TCB77255.1 ArsR family transcriptional regulator [Acinetobacter sp. ANC 4173]